METADMEEGLGRLPELLNKQGNRGFRRYDLKRVDGRMMLVRNEIDLAFDLAMSEELNWSQTRKTGCFWTRSRWATS
jgi:hypothetical protein